MKRGRESRLLCVSSISSSASNPSGLAFLTNKVEFNIFVPRRACCYRPELIGCSDFDVNMNEMHFPAILLFHSLFIKEVLGVQILLSNIWHNLSTKLLFFPASFDAANLLCSCHFYLSYLIPTYEKMKKGLLFANGPRPSLHKCNLPCISDVLQRSPVPG